MEMRPRLVVVAAALLALVAAVALWLGGTTADAPPSDTPPAAAAERLRADAASEPSVATSVADSSAATRSEVASKPAKLATLRGRCVDEHGAPLSDCNVHVRGWPGDERRMSEWLRNQDGQPDWENPAAILTGNDGVFTFTFWPPPPFQFSLDLAHEKKSAMSGRWDTLAEGSDTDVGDVVLSPGVLVAGRVVDEHGTPRNRESIVIYSQRAGLQPDGLIWPTSVAQVSSRADGSFKVRGRFMPGEYELHTNTTELISPKRVKLVAERLTETLELVVRVPTVVETIRGRVLDETGSPASGVRIEDRSDGGWYRADSEGDSTFQLERRDPRGPEHATLRLTSDEYDVATEPRQVAWGSSDVELRVRTAPALTLRVTDEHGAPVETYLVRLIPQSRYRTSSTDSRTRARGHHPDGKVVIPGLTRGQWLLLVEFADASGLTTLAEEFTQISGPKQLDLRAHPQRQRTLRVLGPAGPIARTQVQLCYPWGLPFDDQRQALNMEQWLRIGSSRDALVLFEGHTDAEGRLTLRGPGGRELGICVSGPGHMPMRQAGVRLDEAGELVVHVTTGATLVGKIVPPETLTGLHRLAGGKPGLGFPRGYQPGITLSNDTGTFPPTTHLAGEALQIGDDGTFRFDGLPPGEWQVKVACEALGNRGFTRQYFAAGRVILVDGQTTTLPLDLSFVLPGTLQGSARDNGQPLANRLVMLVGERHSTHVTTDAQGHFETSIAAGDYRAVISYVTTGSTTRIVSATPIHVARDQRCTVELAFASSTLRVTVLDSRGKPIPGVTIDLVGEASYGTLVADEHGVAQGAITTETVTLSTLPKALASQRVRQRALAATPARGAADPFGPHRIGLGKVSPVAGQTSTLEVRLPESSGY